MTATTDELGDCRHCGHPKEQHCGHDMMCNHFIPDDSPVGGHYCNCWDSEE